MGYSTSNNKFTALVLTLAVHLFLLNFIYYGLLEKHKSETLKTLTRLVFVPEPKNQIEIYSSIKPPEDFPHLGIPFHSPELLQLQIEMVRESLYLNNSPEATYKFPNKNSDKYKHLFDPRLRKKLQSLKYFTKSKTRSVDGIEILDVGDGICELTSLSSSPSSGFGAGTVRVKCGNNESEQMIENVEKELKDPLGIND